MPTDRIAIIVVLVTLFSACAGDVPDQTTKPVEPVASASRTIVFLDNLLTPVESSNGGHATVRYGVSITFNDAAEKPLYGSYNFDPLKGLADDAMKRFTLEQVNDKDFGKAYAAELRRQLKANVKDTSATEVELLWLNVDQPVEEPSNMGSFLTDRGAWLKLEELSSPVAAASGKTLTVRYSLLIRFSGDLAEQAEILARWEQSGSKNILRSLADDVMKKYDMDRVRDESFKRVYAEELRKTINLNSSDKVERIVVSELRYD